MPFLVKDMVGGGFADNVAIPFWAFSQDTKSRDMMDEDAKDGAEVIGDLYDRLLELMEPTSVLQLKSKSRNRHNKDVNKKQSRRRL